MAEAFCAAVGIPFIAEVLSWETGGDLSEHSWWDGGAFHANLGGCPRTDCPAAETPFWSYFPLIFVKWNDHLPQISEKSASKWRSLATDAVLGQPPS